jgi:hypothetical protein
MRFFSFFYFIFFALEVQAEEKWSARAGLRYTERVHNDGLETKIAGFDSSK